MDIPQTDLKPPEVFAFIDKADLKAAHFFGRVPKPDLNAPVISTFVRNQPELHTVHTIGIIGKNTRTYTL